MYHNQIVHHKPCSNLFILHNNLLDNQGSEINKDDIFCTFQHTVLYEKFLPTLFYSLSIYIIYICIIYYLYIYIYIHIYQLPSLRFNSGPTVYCFYVKCKKLCNWHSSFFSSFFPSCHFFWTDWQKLFSKFCPIAALNACDQDRS